MTAEQLFFDHWPGCQNCRPRNDIYCAQGRQLWINDQACFVIGLTNIVDRRYWLGEMRRNMPQWIDEIEQRITTEWGNKK